MKNVKLIGFLMLLVSSLMFIQCTSENALIGPQGIAGVDGVDGTNGIDGDDGANGVDGTATCVSCHSEDHRTPIEASYMLSAHAEGGAVGYAGSRASCARCHSNEGYLNYLDGAEAVDIDNPTAVSCTTCHESHSTFDFENDGFDYALRKFEPVTLFIDGTTVIDFGDTSNACIDCHQPRNSYAIPSGIDPITITSKRYGPHHGPQSTVVEGIMGANIAGSVGYPGIGASGDSAHRTGSSCVKCHMGETTDGNDGQHSWNYTEKTCLTCHTSGAPSEVSDFATDLQTLHDLLFAKNYISESGYVQGANGGDASSSNPLVVPAVEAQAIWNYKTLVEDNSDGIHNPKYAKALLKNSIEALQP